jgi:hypothetical protein
MGFFEEYHKIVISPTIETYIKKRRRAGAKIAKNSGTVANTFKFL